MTIETTINITMKNKIILERGAEKLKITKNELVKRLILRYLNKNLEKYAEFTRIQYQKKEESDSWKSIHVWLPSEFYDKCQDLRKFHKLSISFILAKAIGTHLEELLNGINDEYYHNYMFISFIHNGCPVFIITWDYPGNIFTKNILNLYDKYT